MEISEGRLQALVREVDEVHRAGMATIAADIAELHAGEGRRAMGATRRHVLRGLGVGGISIAIGSTVLPWNGLLDPAWADQAADDKALAKFAESVELAAVAAYQAAAASGKITAAAVLSAAQTFASHHRDHAAAFGGLAGDASTAKPNPLVLAAVTGQIKAAPDQNGVLGIALDLENGAAATYLFALGALADLNALKLTASILPVESQHAVVLGTALGKQLKDLVPAFQTADAKIDPAKFPPAS
jgi:ferritin-like protein